METSETGSFLKSFIISFYLVVVMWCVKWVEFKYDINFASFGIVPRTVPGLIGILIAPFIHEDFVHLTSNSLPLLITTTMLWYFFEEMATKTFLSIYIITGIGVWLLARPAIHIGASGVIYGLTAFLFFSGLFRRDYRLMALSLLIIFLYGSLIWGIFPFIPEISWESHLIGGLVGTFIAFLFRKQGPQRKVYSIEIEEDDLGEEDEYWNTAEEPGTDEEEEDKQS
ncbi:rhomboid family intramembrane serine protease [Solitalea koreensis]|uniref:Membrane associated serine protease, rhomboid family n=1 Tax=Solitalea koreensis TaxID=543615 RepID=A0A521DJE4_9SPHI|nr:rhomboid family intramembrane serine protease [Solitalea koreensis]SMO71715.1 Membrane associated serine protease, rhomboid family [Solitalea koreensis]